LTAAGRLLATTAGTGTATATISYIFTVTGTAPGTSTATGRLKGYISVTVGTINADVELVVVTYLRSVTEVAAAVSTRVFTVTPNSPTFPLVRVYRIGGGTPAGRSRRLDAAALQVDVFAETKKEAADILATVRAALSVLHIAVGVAAVVSAVQFGPARYIPDPDFTPAMPRYSADITVTIHP
jgi:hypothetical protein